MALFICLGCTGGFICARKIPFLIFGHRFSFNSWLAGLPHGNTGTKSAYRKRSRNFMKGFLVNTRIYQWATFNAYHHRHHTFSFQGCHIQLPSALDMERYPVECIKFQTCLSASSLFFRFNFPHSVFACRAFNAFPSAFCQSFDSLNSYFSLYLCLASERAILHYCVFFTALLRGIMGVEHGLLTFLFSLVDHHVYGCSHGEY